MRATWPSTAAGFGSGLSYGHSLCQTHFEATRDATYGRGVERDARRPAALVTAAAVVVSVFVTYLLTTWPPEPPESASLEIGPSVSPSPGLDPSPNRTGRANEPDESDPAAVLAVGDSFTSGSDENAGPEWPQILGESLGWEMSVDAVPGSGYLAPGRTEPFGDRVDDLGPPGPDLVLLAGGINDLRAPADEVAAEAAEVVETVSEVLPDARIVLFSPFSNGEPGPLTVELAARLEQVAEAKGVDYLDATRFLIADDLIGSDGLHPNQSGQERLAQQIEAALLDLGVAQAQPDR